MGIPGFSEMRAGGAGLAAKPCGFRVGVRGSIKTVNIQNKIEINWVSFFI
jgi:hypothetical protein